MQAAMNGLTLCQACEPNRPASTTCRPALCVVAQGRERIIECDASECLAVTADLPVGGCVTGADAGSPCLGPSLDLDPAGIADLPLAASPASARKGRSSAAFDVGCHNPSQFSRECRRTFGVPSAARLRASSRVPGLRLEGWEP